MAAGQQDEEEKAKRRRRRGEAKGSGLLLKARASFDWLGEVEKSCFVAGGKRFFLTSCPLGRSWPTIDWIILEHRSFWETGHQVL